MSVTCRDEPNPERIAWYEGLRKDGEFRASHPHFCNQTGGFGDSCFPIHISRACLNGSDFERAAHSGSSTYGWGPAKRALHETRAQKLLQTAKNFCGPLARIIDPEIIPMTRPLGTNDGILGNWATGQKYRLSGD